MMQFFNLMWHRMMEMRALILHSVKQRPII
jgi:hypothetical protein